MESKIITSPVGVTYAVTVPLKEQKGLRMGETGRQILRGIGTALIWAVVLALLVG